MDALDRERRTLRRMLDLYCRAHHGTAGSLCERCQDLLDYAGERLARCPHGAGKPACRDCAIHCYSAEKRQAIQAVMRFAGPRLLLRDPLGALRHLVQRRTAKKGTRP